MIDSWPWQTTQQAAAVPLRLHAADVGFDDDDPSTPADLTSDCAGTRLQPTDHDPPVSFRLINKWSK